jgi:hypothetical protein
MKWAIILIFVFVALSGSTFAQDPYPDSCKVIPWDWFENVFMAPGTDDGSGSPTGQVGVLVKDEDGNTISGAHVVIDLSDCDNLCIDPTDAGLSGMTNDEGEIYLNPAVGGCEDCTVIVKADDFPIRTFHGVTSTDWNGSAADGFVNSEDFAFFAAAFKQTQDDCANYDRSHEGVGAIEFAWFSISFKWGDANPNGCGGP